MMYVADYDRQSAGREAMCGHANESGATGRKYVLLVCTKVCAG